MKDELKENFNKTAYVHKPPMSKTKDSSKKESRGRKSKDPRAKRLTEKPSFLKEDMKYPETVVQADISQTNLYTFK